MPPLENATHLLCVSEFPDLSRSDWLLLTAFPGNRSDPVGIAQSKAAEPGAETFLKQNT